LPVIPFLPKPRRVLIGAFVSMATIFCWAMVFRSDRNLQGFLPILVVVTVATIVRVWRLGGPGRLGLALVVGLQIVWGADAVFSGTDRLQAGVALLKSTWDGRAGQRFNDYRRSYRDIGRAMPRDAVVVLHHQHVSLGINRRILLDWVGFQGLIDYRTFKTPRDAYDRFIELGVTHIVDVPGGPTYSKQEDVIYGTFVEHYAKRVKDSGGIVLWEMPKTTPPVEAPLRVFAVGMGNYSDGIYTVDKMAVNELAPPDQQVYPPPDVPIARDGRAAALKQVNAAIVTPSAGLDVESNDVLSRSFRVTASYAPYSVYVRIKPE
jgi:hypothetical protein